MNRRKFIKTNLKASVVLTFPILAEANTYTNLPNVLILGDSISMGYTPFIIKELASEVIVSRPLQENGKYENCQGTTNGILNIDRWLGTTHWDIIHFNFGLHDLKHVDPVTGKNSNKKEDPLQADLKQYKKNLKKIIKRLKETDAKLIFATTTPYPRHPAGPLRDFEMSKKYNKTALKIMKKNKIMINDLYSFVLPRMEELQIEQNVHFTEKGSQILGKIVANEIKKYI